MSQAKVDQHKQEKYNRKQTLKKEKTQKIIIRVVVALFAAAAIFYLGYSAAISTGLYEPKTTMSAEEKESLRNKLIQQGDQNVQNVETTAAAVETTTVAE